MIGAGSEVTATMMLNLAAMNNPIMSQIVLGANRPLFRGTAEHFPEFRRQWGEYLRLIKSSYPGMGQGQLVNLLKSCLDPASSIQLQREIEENSEITVGEFMATLERDFGKDYSLQAREEWAAVQLHVSGSSLTSKEWRTFQQQFEVAASRVEDKGEREEYELLFKQLSNHWQEKVIKEETTRADGKDWLRLNCQGPITKEEVE